MPTDLFTWRENYPYKPGHRGVDTSRQAAVAIAFKASPLQQLVIDTLHIYGMLTTESIASICKEPFDNIQPRTSELRRKGIIEDAGIRQKNDRGKNVIVWKLKNSPQGFGRQGKTANINSNSETTA